MTTTTPTIISWLTPEEFAIHQCKTSRQIRRWCQSGFIVELGLLLRRDPTGHWYIGIPSTHSDYGHFGHVPRHSLTSSSA